ncbi:hypothetical protein AURDEDRAFT_164004 [Auricularia subglabra TFB-10046 SS5]|nr:hypothetical protein AURDEDRAFT_164004 [Auricularia subglabra TFB-10046 SS5]
MASPPELPAELVAHIIELAAGQAAFQMLPWALSLLLLSRSFHALLAPLLYRNVRITRHNSDAFLSTPSLLRHMCHVRTLQFFSLTDLAQQRSWAEARAYMAALAPGVVRFRGPRKIMGALAAHASFLPTHWRADPPIVSESLFGPRGKPSRTIARMSHAYVAFVSPMRVMASTMDNPPALSHVCVVPHVVATPSLFLNEVAHIRTAPRLERMVIRLGFMKTAQGKVTRTHCAKLLRAGGAKWKDPRVYIDESIEEFDFDDDRQWFVGEPLWKPEV